MKQSITLNDLTYNNTNNKKYINLRVSVTSKVDLFPTDPESCPICGG